MTEILRASRPELAQDSLEHSKHSPNFAYDPHRHSSENHFTILCHHIFTIAP